MRAARAVVDDLFRLGIARSGAALDNRAKRRRARGGTSNAPGLSRQTTNSHQERSNIMNTASMFESINVDQLADVTGAGPTPPTIKTPVSELVTPSTPLGQTQQTYVVRPGDTLSSIAEAAVGDGRQWRGITDANLQPPDPRTLQPGQLLVIPRRA
jgi:nucleoid-associated protein YgaU